MARLIISASRRTDIPAFFGPWLMERIRAGYCTVVNPYNRRQVSYVSLEPKDVDALFFWTKYPGPLLPHLAELDQRGFRYCFQYTLNGYPELFEPGVPPLEQCIATFVRLADLIGPERVTWRYDPIILSNLTDRAYHRHCFTQLAKALAGSTTQVVISILDNYRKAADNFRRLAAQGVQIELDPGQEAIGDLVGDLAETAARHGLHIQSCAEAMDLTPFGVAPGKCIDDHYLKQVFGIDVGHRKDPSQRAECGCVVSKDIGMYDTCLHGCSYCYAGTLAAGERNQLQHFVDSPSLLGRYESERPPRLERTPSQLRLS